MAGRVLIVEDDPLVRMMTAEMIEECGLSVVEVSSADEALQTLDEIADEIAVVITDVRMPGDLDGVDLAKFVSAAWPDIRVLVTSGYTSGRVSALPKTVTFLPKPSCATIEQAREKARYLLTDSLFLDSVDAWGLDFIQSLIAPAV